MLVCASIAGASLAIAFWLVDVCKAWTGAPLIYLGRNSIAVYVLAQMARPFFPFTFVPTDLRLTHGFALVQNGLGTALFVGIAFLMAHEQIRLKL